MTLAAALPSLMTAAAAQAQDVSATGQVLGYGETGRIKPLSERKKTVQLSGKVRIELEMIQFAKVEARTLQGHLEAKTVERMPQTFRLNAGLEGSNVFHVNGYKVETQPLSWNRHTGDYAMNLRFNRLYGEYSQLEEFAGEIQVKGQLIKFDASTFTLLADAKALFLDKVNEPLLRVAVGAREVDSLARGPRSSGGDQSRAR